MAQSPLFNDEERVILDCVADGKTVVQLLNFCHEELKRKDVTFDQMKRFLHHHPDIKIRMNIHSTKKLFTDEQESWIAENSAGKTTKELTKDFNETWGTDLNCGQMRDWCKSRKSIRSKMLNANKRSFQIGTGISDKIGCISQNEKNEWIIKIRQDKGSSSNWQRMSRIVWENAHGYTPHNLVHLDGNKGNDSLDNLLPISKQALAIMTSRKLWKYDEPQLTKARILMCEIEARKNKLKKDGMDET